MWPQGSTFLLFRSLLHNAAFFRLKYQDMPRFSMRPLLVLSTFLLFCWAFGLPSWPRLQGKQPAQVTFKQAQGAVHSLEKPWKKRVVAIGGKQCYFLA
jgi:hypothetical protein